MVMRPDPDRTPQGIMDAIYKLHTGELTAGTLASRLNVPAEILISILQHNGVMDSACRLVKPSDSYYTVIVVIFQCIEWLRQRNSRADEQIAMLKKKVANLNAGKAPSQPTTVETGDTL